MQESTRTTATSTFRALGTGQSGTHDAGQGAAGARARLGGAAAASSVALELLNRTLLQLLEEPESRAPFDALLGSIECHMGAEASLIMLSGDLGAGPEVLACTAAEGSRRLVREARRVLDAARDSATPPGSIRSCEGSGGAGLLGIPIRGERRTMGVLVFRVARLNPAGVEAPAWMASLVDGLARLLENVERARQHRRKGLYDERAAIARELHDSLAQSLSYLKIQVSRLQSLLGREPGRAAPEPGGPGEVVEEIRSSLNLAYRQLRELMTTFRLTMNGRTLAQALEDSIEELEKRSSIAFDLDNRLCGDRLSVDEEMQVLQLVREALTNVVRHSHARRVNVSLADLDDRGIRLLVDDDGVGIGAAARREQHHGMIIMQERAHRLGGEIKVRERAGGGTRLEVSFIAATRASPSGDVSRED